jgi:hypothetical protein
MREEAAERGEERPALPSPALAALPTDWAANEGKLLAREEVDLAIETPREPERVPIPSRARTPVGEPAPLPAQAPERVPAPVRAPGLGAARKRPSDGQIFSLAAELSAGMAEDVPMPGGAAESNKPKQAVGSSVDEVVLAFGPRRWRIRGMLKNSTPGVLKVNLFVSREGGGFHVDQVDLYAARQRGAYVKQAAGELSVEEEVIKRDLGVVLLELEKLQEKQIQEAAAPKSVAVELTEEERRAALELLRSPELLERILTDFEGCGVVGERNNKLVGYLAATSRLLERPLGVVIQSTSAAGKSSLMNAILSFIPEEERKECSAMTGQALFYMNEQNLKHKILAIAEEQGAERASYALKLLQSEGKLSILSTGKDPQTGKLEAQSYEVEGPVMIFLTTTAIDVDEELLNRCLVLTVDESREQTKAIHGLQRQAKSLAGLMAKEEKKRLVKLHQNAQRLLLPLSVVNPFVEKLGFPDHQTRTRRDFPKYLALIEVVTLLHQYQRPIREVEHGGQRLRYVEVTAEDIAMANRLAHEVLGRSLDELPPQTRSLLCLLDPFVAEGSKKQGVERSEFRFSRREVRENFPWSYEQLRVHLGRLVDFEYLVVHRGKRGQGFVYELAYEGRGKDGTPFMSGLIDIGEADGTSTTESLGGRKQSLGGASSEFGVGYWAHTGPLPGGLLGTEKRTIEYQNSSRSNSSVLNGKNARSGSPNGKTSVVVELSRPPRKAN